MFKLELRLSIGLGNSLRMRCVLTVCVCVCVSVCLLTLTVSFLNGWQSCSLKKKTVKELKRHIKFFWFVFFQKLTKPEVKSIRFQGWACWITTLLDLVNSHCIEKLALLCILPLEVTMSVCFSLSEWKSIRNKSFFHTKRTIFGAVSVVLSNSWQNHESETNARICIPLLMKTQPCRMKRWQNHWKQAVCILVTFWNSVVKLFELIWADATDIILWVFM